MKNRKGLLIGIFLQRMKLSALLRLKVGFLVLTDLSCDKIQRFWFKGDDFFCFHVGRTRIRRSLFCSLTAPEQGKKRVHLHHQHQLLIITITNHICLIITIIVWNR